MPSNYLNKGPDIVDQRSGKKDVYNDQHYKTENVKGQTAELIILFRINFMQISLFSFASFMQPEGLHGSS